MMQVHHQLPPRVYVPTVVAFGAPASSDVAVARDLTGRGELLCYSSPEQLRRTHGVGTPWRGLDRDQVAQVLTAKGVTALRLDSVPVVPLSGDAQAVPQQRAAATPR